MGIFPRQTGKQKLSKKIAGVIEAVRRDPHGKIEIVRYYERRGPTWSDLKLMNRGELIERLKKGEAYVIGNRKIYWAGTFQVVTEVKLESSDSREHLATALTPNGNIELKEAPLF